MSSKQDATEVEAERLASRIVASPPRASPRSAVTAPRGASSGGSPLDDATRAYLEPLVGRDLGDVRVHTDAASARSAERMGAQAYTVGTDVVFGADRYQPGTTAGRRLLAHEVAHVAQQTATPGVRAADVHVARQALDSAPAPLATPAHAASPGDAVLTVDEYELAATPAPAAATPAASTTPPLTSSATAAAPAIVGAAAPWTNALAWGSARWPGQPPVFGSRYWAPFWQPSPWGVVTLDRTVEALPRDLLTSLESGGVTNPSGFDVLTGRSVPHSTWTGPPHNFTSEEVRSIGELVRRYNAQGWNSLEAAEQALLRRAVALHIGGSVTGAPLMSFSEPGRAPTLGNKRFRIRIQLPRGDTLNPRALDPFTGTAPFADLVNNPSEFEVLATTAQDGRVISVEPMGRASSSFQGWVFRNSHRIRVAGHLLLGAGAALSVARIVTADDTGAVLGEEAGAWGGGLLGGAAAAGTCLLLGAPSGGLVLFLCGLAGTAGGGVAGSRVLGPVGRDLGEDLQEGVRQVGNPETQVQMFGSDADRRRYYQWRAIETGEPEWEL